MRASRIRSRPPAGADLNTYAARGRTSSRSPALAGLLPLAPRREAREPLHADRSCPSTSNGCRTCPRRVTMYIKRRASLECKVSGLRLLRGRSGDESARLSRPLAGAVVDLVISEALGEDPKEVARALAAIVDRYKAEGGCTEEEIEAD